LGAGPAAAALRERGAKAYLAGMTDASSSMPAVFVGHGSPMTAFEDNAYVRSWKAMGERLPRPKAILAISAHWMTRGTAVTDAERPATVHDFYGFPEALYRFRYDAPGSPDLAARAAALAGPGVMGSQRWGFDHGTWTVLMHAYPQADIPVVQLSLDANLTPAAHYALGQRLAPLRDEGVLVMGTGNIVHNLRIYDRSGRAPPNPVAEGFRKEVQARLVDHDRDGLIACLDRPEARMTLPTTEHFLPLLYVAALQREGETPSFFNEVTEGGGVDMTSVVLAA
jgi:4,5-DOPA dioxygenase extradiol